MQPKNFSLSIYNSHIQKTETFTDHEVIQERDLRTKTYGKYASQNYSRGVWSLKT